jgi:hypothetical protein
MVACVHYSLTLKLLAETEWMQETCDVKGKQGQVSSR